MIKKIINILLKYVLLRFIRLTASVQIDGKDKSNNIFRPELEEDQIEIDMGCLRLLCCYIFGDYSNFLLNNDLDKISVYHH